MMTKLNPNFSLRCEAPHVAFSATRKRDVLRFSMLLSLYHADIISIKCVLVNVLQRETGSNQMTIVRRVDAPASQSSRGIPAINATMIAFSQLSATSCRKIDEVMKPNKAFNFRRNLVRAGMYNRVRLSATLKASQLNLGWWAQA